MNWREPWEYLFIPYKEHIETKIPPKRKRDEEHQEIEIQSRAKKRQKVFIVRKLKRKREEITPDDSSCIF